MRARATAGPRWGKRRGRAGVSRCKGGGAGGNSSGGVNVCSGHGAARRKGVRGRVTGAPGECRAGGAGGPGRSASEPAPFRGAAAGRWRLHSELRGPRGPGPGVGWRWAEPARRGPIGLATPPCVDPRAGDSDAAIRRRTSRSESSMPRLGLRVTACRRTGREACQPEPESMSARGHDGRRSTVRSGSLAGSSESWQAVSESSRVRTFEMAAQPGLDQACLESAGRRRRSPGESLGGGCYPEWHKTRVALRRRATN